MRGLPPTWVGCLALCGAALALPARSAEAVKIAVALIESRGAPLGADVLQGLTDALGQWLAKGQRLEVVPRAAPVARTQPGYTIATVVSKVGAACVWTLHAYRLPDGVMVASATEKGPCEEEALIGLLEQAAEELATTLLRVGREEGAQACAAPPGAPAPVSPLPPAAPAPPGLPVVAVFQAESLGSPLSADEINSLTDYLSTRLGEAGTLLVLHRSELLTRLGPEAAHELDACHEPVCRHHLSSRAGAGFALSTWVGKVGSQCLLVAEVLDTSTNRLVGAVHVRVACLSDSIIEGFDRLGSGLSDGFNRADRQGGPKARRVAVLTLESRGSPVSADELGLLTGYLRASLLTAAPIECVPGAELRRKAGDKAASAPAELSVRTSIAKIGSQCLISASLWDLAKNEQLAAASSREPCDADALVSGLERVADKLARLLSKP
jgi:hypothetical protein